MNRFPPTLSRLVVAGTLLALALAGGGCNQAHPDDGVGGLVIAADGTIRVTIAEREQLAVEGPPGGGRRITSSKGRIVAESADDEFFVSDAPGVGAVRAWRPLTFEDASARTSAGMDLSPDGRTVAIVLGDPEAAGLELVTLAVETGAASTRSIDLTANGPPTWLGPDQLAVEVILADQHSGIATVEVATGAVTVTDAQGFALSATHDGNRIAVADPISGLVSIMDRKDWLVGVPSGASGITPPTDTTIQGVAISADGTRLALACSANTGTSWSVVILGQAGTRWEKATSISIPGDAAVSIDWLE